MKITADNKYELIDKFVGGQMDSNESEAFAAIIAQDEELSAEVNLVKELHEFQDFSIREENLKATLSEIHQPNTSKIRSLRYVIIGAAASLLMVFFFKSLSVDKNAFQMPIAAVEPLELIVKGDEVPFKDLALMQELYNGENYKEAYPYLLSYLEENPRNIDAQLAKGICLMKMEKYSEASDIFNYIESLNPRVQKHKWYLAINYLSQGQKEKAKLLLAEIADQKTYNHEEASKLINSMQ